MSFDGRSPVPPTRRQLLAAVGAGLASGLAGCGDGGQSNGTPAPDGGGNADGGSNGDGQNGGTPTATDPGTDTPAETATPAQETIDRPALEMAIGQRVNELRQANGVGFIDWDDELRQIARDHSTAMLQQDYFGHVSPMGNDWGDRYEDANYRCAVRTHGGIRDGGECIARVSYEGLPTQERIAVEVVDMLRTDTEGGAMLANYWNVHGIGIAWQSAGTETTIYVTENFC